MERPLVALSGRSPLAEQVCWPLSKWALAMYAFLAKWRENSPGPKTYCPRDDQCSRSCADAQTGVGEASGPALPAFASGKRGRESFGGPFGLTGTLRLVLLTLF
jgi:hypothetical protein